MSETNFIRQMALFEKGPHGGKTAIMIFPKPVVAGSLILVRGERYELAKGPITSIIEQTQAPMEHGCVRLIFQPYEEAQPNLP